MTEPSSEYFSNQQQIFTDLDDVLAASSSDFVSAEIGALPEHVGCYLLEDWNDGVLRLNFVNWRLKLFAEISKIETSCEDNAYWRKSIIKGQDVQVRYLITIYDILHRGFDVVGSDGDEHKADWISVEVYEDGSSSMSYQVENDDDNDEENDEFDDDDNGDAITVLELRSTDGQASEDVIKDHIYSMLDTSEWLEDFRQYREHSFNSVFVDTADPES